MKLEKKLADLAVVIPVYNEEKNIEDCIESWMRALTDLGINYRLIVLNDGSRDCLLYTSDAADE